MNNAVAIGIGVGIGLILGGSGSFIVCNTVIRKRYDQQLEIELAASKEVYRRLIKKLKEDNKKEIAEAETKVKSNINLNKPSLEIQRTNYMSIAKEYGNIEKTSAVRIEPISPEDYGLLEEEGFTTEELYYYADGTLASEYDEVIEDPNYAGDFRDHFEDYEDDEVYMRNYTDKIDIHILKSAKTYKEAVTDIFPAPTEESEE